MSVLNTLALSIAVPVAMLVTACAAPDSPTDTPDASAAYGAYMIVSGKDYAAADLGPYAATLPPIYAKYGGEYVAFSTADTLDVLEGRTDLQAIVISGWPDVESAQRFWASPEYRESIKLREGIGTFDVVIVPALPQR